ncbi:MAG: metal-dependent hydrolase, partial [Acidobacteria bacterium]|nr:metal-dependent hydrolase [Acidobacteriota bacterium]
HAIAGTLVAKAFFSERQGREATLAAAAGSVFPDLDILANLFYRDRIAFLEIHRGITHSLVALPVFAVLLGGLTSLLIRRKQKWLLFSCIYGIAVGLHIFMDLITSFGTMIWSPLSKARFSWDMTFLVDVVFTTIVLLPQLTAWVYSDRQRARRRACAVWLCLTVAGVVIARLTSRVEVPISGWTLAIASVLIAAVLWAPSLSGRGFQWRCSAYCQAGVAALAIYLGLCAIAHQVALSRVKEFAKLSEVIVENLAALPSPPSFLRWSGLVQSPKGVYWGSIDLANSSQRAYRLYPNAEDNQYLQAAETLPDVRIFLWFARFPWVTYQHDDGLHVVEIRDVQFLWPPRDAASRFTLRVFLDGQGRVLSHGFLER